MNANRYRLVFDDLRGMLVPVCEHQSAHGKRSGSDALLLTLAVLLAVGGAAGDAAAQAVNTMRVPAATLAALSRPAAAYVPAVSAFTGNGYGTYTVNGSYGEVRQTAQRAIYGWTDHNIGRLAHLHYEMPSGGSAVSRIGSADPTVIEGKLTATGQLFLINQNGILFGNGAQVNVGGLVASTLNISQDALDKGWLLLAGKQASFAFEGTADQYARSFVRVEAGASLMTSIDGGRVFLFAPRVENAGTITTPGGQAMLAAGSKVYLSQSDDPRMRGIVVEVDPFVSADKTVNIGGSVSVERLGQVVAERGNVSLAGLAVSQGGRVRATTTVDVNGSIVIKAGDVHRDLDASGNTTYEYRGGTAVLEAGSVTEIATAKAWSVDVDGNRKERLIADNAIMAKSLVEISGKTVELAGRTADASGASIEAHSGEVRLSAFDGQYVDGFEGAGGQRIVLGTGSSIDVSGLKAVAVPIERNIVAVQLNGGELQDSPLLRDGALKGVTVNVDARKGTLIADVSSSIAKIERTVEERSTEGGIVTLRSEQDVIVAPQAKIDVSGGSYSYAGGTVSSTWLTYAGGFEQIGNARRGIVYDGTRSISRFEAGYSEGKSAGSIAIYANRMALAGDLRGNVTPGVLQRDSGKLPKGGKLDLASSLWDLQQGWVVSGLAQDVRLSAPAVDFSGIDPAQPLPAGQRLDLSTDSLSAGGFSHVGLTASGNINLQSGAALAVQPTGDIRLAGAAVTLDGKLSARGGTVDVSSNAALSVGAAGSVDTSGLWTNDLRVSGTSTDPIILNGGTINLKSGSDLTLARGSLLDASAGGRVYSDTKGNVKTSVGNGGTIALTTGRSAEDQRATSRLDLSGELRAFASSDGSATGKGGTLKITTSNVSIGGAATGAAGELHLATDALAQGGFKDFEIDGRDGLTVAAGTGLASGAPSRVLGRNARGQLSSTDMASFAAPRVLAEELRTPASVTLKASNKLFGDVLIGRGAELTVEPGGNLNLSAGHRVTVDGTLRAAGGNINLSLIAPTGSDSFDPTRSLWLTDNARLLAAGTVKRNLLVLNRNAGEVLDGGRVSLDAASGFLVTQAGSLIDVSGTVATLDRRLPSGAYASLAVPSAGGSIALSAREGMLLDGQMKAQGGSSLVSGGALSVSQDRNDGVSVWAPSGDGAVDGVLAGARRVTLAATGNAGTAALVAGQAIDPLTRSGQAVIAADRVRDGGFASLALHAQDDVRLSGTFDLALTRAVTIDAPNLAADADSRVALSAAYVGLGNAKPVLQSASLRQAPTSGTAEVTLTADLLELTGSVATQGMRKLALNSTGDLRLRGVAVDKVLRGELATAADLAIRAARVYPSTLTEFELAIHNNPTGKISFAPVAGASREAPLSAGGTLLVSAPIIEQSGVLQAPFGAIELRADELSSIGTLTSTTRTRAASGSVTLEDGSLTSVSGAGLDVPFGKTDLSGREWFYQLALGDTSASGRTIDLPPEKRVQMSGTSVLTRSGAQVDLSGGGDLKAWEFTPGRGGSADVLDNLSNPNSFAVIPSAGTAFAAYDTQAYLGSALQGGERIRLMTAAGGLAAGEYTLLPARYALLPGAYLVTLKGSTFDGVRAATTQTDGSVIAAAVRTAAVAGGGSVATSSRVEQVEVASSAVVRSRAAYSETQAETFFADTAGARRPGDAGRLVIEADSRMQLEATLTAGHAATHRGAEVDIAARNMSIVGAGQIAGAGSVAVDLASLNRIGADSVLLGGVRSHDANGTSIQIIAEQLTIDTGSASSLRAPEVIAAASQTLSVRDGSTVEGSGVLSGTPETISLVGDGALLRVAGGAQATLVRSGTTLAQGTLDLQAGSTVKGKSAILDSTSSTVLGGNFVLADQGALTIGAKRISIGTTSPTEGIAFANDDLGRLGTPSALNLTSYSTLDLYGDATLGSGSLAQLTVQAAGIAGYDNAGRTATLSAGRVVLANPGATSFVPAGATGSGQLAINAARLEFGTGDFTMQGFAGVSARASDEIRVSGSGTRDASGNLNGHQVKGGSLELLAPRITAATGADQALRAEGVLSTVRLADGALAALPAGIGGRLELSGTRVEHGGRIDLPVGDVGLTANGGAAGDGVTLLAGSQINATGYARTFADTTVAVAGGKVRLTSVNGDVSVASAGSSTVAALVDVSGVGGAGAGSIEISAARGTLNMAGNLSGMAPAVAGSSPRQGSFSADARSLGDLHALNVALESGGFKESRVLRQREGSAVLGEAGRTKAEQSTYTARNFSLSTDNGAISVFNRIDAAGSKGGRIELLANNGDLVLQNSATLVANATEVLSKESGTAGQGGDVLLGAAGTGKLRVLDGATIEVGAASGSVAQGGSVNFRASRSVADGVNVFFETTDALRKLASTISGAAEVAVEGVKVYDKISSTDIASIGSGTSSGSKLGMSSVQTDSTTDFSAARLAALESRLGFTDTATTNYRLRPGVEVRAAGDLTLASSWDLLTARYGDNAGVLTLRARGDLKLENSLSDGFLAAPSNGTYQQNLLLSGDGWSYRLVGGADISGANPLALAAAASLATGKGNVLVGKSTAAASVRTGTGDIDVAAARDIALLNKDSAVFTAGIGDQSVAMRDYYNGTAFAGATARAEFGKNGGDLRLFAGSDIYSVSKTATTAVTAGSKNTGTWLGRFGQNDADQNSLFPVAWWTQLKNFSQGFGVLGSGDLLASAGGNIANAAFVAPTSGRLYSTRGERPDPAALLVMGGGDVKVFADGNIDSTLFLAGTGDLKVEAGRQMGSKHTTASKADYSTFLLGDAALHASSRGQMSVGSVDTPTNPDGVAAGTAAKPYAYFYTYGTHTAADFVSSGAGVSLNGSGVYPGSVRAVALGGDLTTGGFTMAPAASGQLELLASGSIAFSGTVNMTDTRESALATAWRVQKTRDLAIATVGAAGERDTEVLHRDDLQPARVIADGNISRSGSYNGDVSLRLPKPVRVEAGGNIRNFSVYADNLRASDISRLAAGGEISYGAHTLSSSEGGFILGGPGRGEVIAGGSIDLANSLGIISRGNLANPYLSDEGAALFVMAGSRFIDYTGLKAFLSSAGASFSGLPGSAYDKTVAAYVSRLGIVPSPDLATARTIFDGLASEVQAPVLREALFAVLRDSGVRKLETKDKSSYEAGYATIAAAFPGTPAAMPAVGSALPAVPYKGDINLFFSQVKTERGGSIELLAPGGKVNAGLANAGSAVSKPAYQLGVMTLDGGDIHSYSLGSFEVNQSRVFTLGGGDILLWSSYGDLDAGKGKKTASAAPPPVFVYDRKTDSFVLDVSNSISGSGIGVLDGKPGVAKANVYLFAPIGTIDAGEAGISSTGGFFGDGEKFLNTPNINAGFSVGTPTAPAAPALSIASVSSATAGAERGGDQSTQAGSTRSRVAQSSLLSVEVLALGDTGDAAPAAPAATRAPTAAQDDPRRKK